MQYLSGTSQLGLFYSPKNEKNFRREFEKVTKEGGKTLGNTVCFSDADFAGCTVTFRSTSGSILYHRGTPVTWHSKRQTIRALRTTEAEYCALYDCIRLVQDQGYLNFFLEEGKLPLFFCDSKSAIAVAESSLITKRSKHMNLRLHLVRDHVDDLCYVNTEINMADPLTKPLPGHKYLKMFNLSARDKSSNSDHHTAFYVVVEN
jgi:hypothetical protein